MVALRRSIEKMKVRAERDALTAEAERLAAAERVQEGRSIVGVNAWARRPKQAPPTFLVFVL